MPWTKMMASVFDLVPEVRVRRSIGVHIRIWDWNDAQLDAAAEMLQMIRDIVAEGYFYGSEIGDIEDDLLDRLQHLFAELDLTMDEKGEFELIMVPCDTMDAPEG